MESQISKDCHWAIAIAVKLRTKLEQGVVKAVCQGQHEFWMGGEVFPGYYKKWLLPSISYETWQQLLLIVQSPQNVIWEWALIYFYIPNSKRCKLHLCIAICWIHIFKSFVVPLKLIKSFILIILLRLWWLPDITVGDPMSCWVNYLNCVPTRR